MGKTRKKTRTNERSKDQNQAPAMADYQEAVGNAAAQEACIGADAFAEFQDAHGEAVVDGAFEKVTPSVLELAIAHANGQTVDETGSVESGILNAAGPGTEASGVTAMQGMSTGQGIHEGLNNVDVSDSAYASNASAFSGFGDGLNVLGGAVQAVGAARTLLHNQKDHPSFTGGAAEHESDATGNTARADLVAGVAHTAGASLSLAGGLAPGVSMVTGAATTGRDGRQAVRAQKQGSALYDARREAMTAGRGGADRTQGESDASYDAYMSERDGLLGAMRYMEKKRNRKAALKGLSSASGTLAVAAGVAGATGVGLPVAAGLVAASFSISMGIGGYRLMRKAWKQDKVKNGDWKRSKNAFLMVKHLHSADGRLQGLAKAAVLAIGVTEHELDVFYGNTSIVVNRKEQDAAMEALLQRKMTS